MMNSQDVELHPLDIGPDGSPMRSILRNKNERDFYDVYDSYGTTSSKIHLQPKETSKQSKCRRFCTTILRPCVAEFLSVITSIVVFFHLESQLVQRHVVFFNKIVVLSITDAILYTVFLSTFRTVHINPVITVAQLFTLTTQWYLCLLFIALQILGSIAGACLFFFFNNGIFPSEPMIIQDLTQDWTKSVYEMILCQIIGTTIIIFSNLLVTKKVSQKTTSWRQLSRSPLPVCGAVGLASLLSLLHSNISWNPLYLLVLITLQALHGKGIQLAFNHLLFWIGPIIGALLGAIIFKLLFAPTENKRVVVNVE
uniref:Aquaporin n=1 Tax=Panagrolaimus sp. ES5 TaxID=591445 RepID=A0AC34F0C0_9BILA